MIIYEVIKDIDWHWCKCKKGNFICINQNSSLFTENPEKLRFIGEFKGGQAASRLPSILDKETLKKRLQILELNLSANLTDIRGLMKRMGISLLMTQ